MEYPNKYYVVWASNSPALLTWIREGRKEREWGKEERKRTGEGRKRTGEGRHCAERKV
jgi:hypothetical protein